ncbi:MAG TPA: tetratricopeptide repeat protein [Burkholderiaceae bacterium]|nr:tetratricopeptide repeat protein [Burkholderiaceae bacterium]
MTTMIDAAGLSVSGANAHALSAFETAQHESRCYINDPVATVERALEASPQMVMAHALKAWLHLLGTEPGQLPTARASYRAGLAAANEVRATERERGHLEAIRLVAEGRWREAAGKLEDLSLAYPRDALALQAGHLIDFYTGDSRMLRDRIARALPAWSNTLPGYHNVLAMHAFGLEETGDYAQAERQGRRSVALEPRDGWGQHAVAHVMEMQNRLRDGIAWMRNDSDAWSRDSFFAVHNWWHLALYYLEAGDFDEVLRLFDGPIYGPKEDGKRSTVILDMIDASALLWRLHLRGVDVGSRWQGLADNWAPVATAGNYAFNDMHAMMAFIGAGRAQAAQAVLEAQRGALDAGGDNAQFTREVGQPATQAIKAFGDGNYAEVIRLLRPIRHYAHRFGGSHAQRDVLDLTLLEGALRLRDKPLATALAAERIALRPHSPFARLLVQRGSELQ